MTAEIVRAALTLPSVLSPPVLRARAITKAPPEPDAAGLSPLSFSLAPGDLRSVAAGAASTMLVALLAGWCLPDDGEIERLGEWARDEGWTTWRHTTVVPAVPLLMPELTVADHVDTVLAALDVPRGRWAPLTLHVLDQMHLVGVAHRPMHELTPAQAQRLSVARAIVGSIAHAVPTMLIADGPTDRQSADGASLVIEALIEAADAGVAVVVATDDEQLARCCRPLVTASDAIPDDMSNDV
jgi:ABC-type ATPase involved in cell division